MDPLQNFNEQLKGFLEGVRRELSSVRTNRPHPGLVEDVKVNHYGGTFPLRQLGSVNVMPPREIRIEVWDASAVPAVAKAVETSALGLTANVDGNVIRIFLPELSDERRRELVKYVGTIAEGYRIKVRHARDDANKDVQKRSEEGEFTEDQKFKLKEGIQKATEQWNRSVEEAVAAKEKDITE